MVQASLRFQKKKFSKFDSLFSQLVKCNVIVYVHLKVADGMRYVMSIYISECYVTANVQLIVPSAYSLLAVRIMCVYVCVFVRVYVSMRICVYGVSSIGW